MLPAWARWSDDAAERPWSVGVEEELMLLDPHGWFVANRVDEVLGALPRWLAARASRETHACVLEVKTDAHDTVRQVAEELAALRRALRATLRDGLGVELAAAGTHPFVTGSEVALCSSPRYEKIGATMRALARREPTMALHVHVAMPDSATAVRVLDGLRAELPLLLALSANSPFWRGRDSGFASMRTPLMSTFPRVGIPRRFGTYRGYVRAVDALIRAGAVPGTGFLWWDARLRPHLGTVEVRITDSQSRVGDSAALAAVVQCLARRLAEEPPGSAPAPEVLDENRFLAARDGIAALLIDGTTLQRRPAVDALAELLGTCRPFAAELDCLEDLSAVLALAGDPGCERQRRAAERDGVHALPGMLAAQFVPARAAHFIPMG